MMHLPGQSSATANEEAPSEGEVRSQLGRILGSEAFDASARNRNAVCRTRRNRP